MKYIAWRGNNLQNKCGEEQGLKNTNVVSSGEYALSYSEDDGQEKAEKGRSASF